MFKSYLLSGYRNLIKQKLSSLINVMGLALAIGCCLVVFNFLEWVWNKDSFNPNRNEIYVAERSTEKNPSYKLWADTPAPLGVALQRKFPDIKAMARIEYLPAVIKRGNQLFEEELSFVDDSFHALFNFPVKWGTRADFTAPGGIVLTEELSEKLYGSTNSVGNILSIRFVKDKKTYNARFTVKGVLAKKPTDASFGFRALIPISNTRAIGLDDLSDWSTNTVFTFIQVEGRQGLLAKTITDNENEFVTQYNAVHPNSKIAGFFFQPLRKIYTQTFLSNSRFYTSNETAITMLAIIAVALLVFVCFNYMNIAMAASTWRLNEISIRKIAGGSRKEIIYQFLAENLLICLAALALGLLLAKFIFVPWFDGMANIDLSLNLGRYSVWVALLALLAIATIGGAGYPSFYISGLKPVAIFKGSSVLGSRNLFRKTLLGVQFFLTFVAVAAAVSFTIQSKKSIERPWGYNQNGVVVLPLKNGENEALLEKEFSKVPQVDGAAGSAQPLGTAEDEIQMSIDGKIQAIKSLKVSPNYFGVMGIGFTQGKAPNQKVVADTSSSILVNEAFSKSMHWKNPVGRSVSFLHHPYHIVGEVRNFHYEAFLKAIEPLVIRFSSPGENRYMALRLRKSALARAPSIIGPVWKQLYPETPLDYYYQNEVFEGYFRGFEQLSEVLSAACLITVIIAVSGIFGLAFLILAKRTKEVAIRKLLGARISSLAILINKEFMISILVACALGVPLSLVLVNGLLKLISPESSMGIIPFIVAPLALIMITSLSVSWHIYKAGTAAPARNLRTQ